MEVSNPRDRARAFTYEKFAWLVTCSDSTKQPVLNRGTRPVLIAFSLAVILTLNNIYLPINIHSVSLRSTFFRATAITCPLFGIVYSPSPVLHLMHHGLAYASHLHSFALQPQHCQHDEPNRRIGVSNDLRPCLCRARGTLKASPWAQA